MSEEAKSASATIGKAIELVMACRQVVAGLSPDTAFAIGEAAGHLARARALLGRDIDQAALAALSAPAPRKRRSRAKAEPTNAAASPQGGFLPQ
jgi:hypothetical protein